jgi:integrase
VHMPPINSGFALVIDAKGKKMSNLLLSGQAYQLFIDSCRSEKTKETYDSSLRAYMLFRKISSVEPLLSEDTKQAQSKVIEFICVQKRNGLSWQTLVIRAAALKHFYEMNDMTLNWKKINRFIGEKARTIQDRAYTKEEIRRMLDKCDERKRVMILLLASTGMRIGALPQLKIKHLARVLDGSMYQISVYDGTPSHYMTFCTPECAKAIDDYLDYRRRCGERLTPESPLIREQFDRNDPFRSVKARPVAQSTIMNTIKQVLLDAGLRPRLPSQEAIREVEEGERRARAGRRKEVMQIHGLRKFYDTATTQAGVHPLYVEMLLGHDIALKGSYFKPTTQDLLEGNDRMLGYTAAIDALTINEENRLKQENQKIKHRNEELERSSDEVKVWKEKFERDMKAMRQELKSEIAHLLGKVKPEVVREGLMESSTSQF